MNFSFGEIFQSHVRLQRFQFKLFFSHDENRLYLIVFENVGKEKFWSLL